MKIKLIDPLNNEKVFESKSAAARFLGVNESSVRKAIKKGKPCQGYYCVIVGLEPVLEEGIFSQASGEFIPRTILSSNKVEHHLIIPDIHIPYANFTILSKIVELTKDNKGIVFQVAFNYGGRDEILTAVNKALESKKNNINQEEFEKLINVNNIHIKKGKYNSSIIVVDKNLGESKNTVSKKIAPIKIDIKKEDRNPPS